MEQTFLFRRKVILEKSHDLSSLFDDCPFLQESDQVRGLAIVTLYLSDPCDMYVIFWAYSKSGCHTEREREAPSHCSFLSGVGVQDCPPPSPQAKYSV